MLAFLHDVETNGRKRNNGFVNHYYNESFTLVFIVSILLRISASFSSILSCCNRALLFPRINVNGKAIEP